jgi:hypothetical protein
VVRIGLAAVALIAAVALVVIASSGGSGGRSLPRTHMGDHADAAALGQQVGRALHRRAGRPPSPDTACAGEARATYGRDLGPLVHAATLRWQGAPAVLLAYRARSSPGLEHRVFVMAREGCQLLVAQSL